MSANINTNIASLNAQRNLNVSQGSLATSLQRLSSGLRINSAKDDAAGLAISERFTSQIKGNNQAARNANDGISLAQTAEGGLSTAGDLLQRIRELAVQSANGSNSSSDRKSINNEVTSLAAELDRVANTTQFNGQNVLDGTLTSQQFQVGANANQVINIGVGSAKASDIGNNTIAPTTQVATSLSQVSDGLGNLSGNGAAAAVADTLVITSGTGLATNIHLNAAGSATGATNLNGDSAKLIAQNVNAVSTSNGVTATASTVATLEGIGLGNVSLTLRGANSLANDGTSKAVTVSATITDTNDLSALAQAVNAQSATTNITASIKTDANGLKELQLNESSGNDIQVAATGTGITGSATAGMRGADLDAATPTPTPGATILFSAATTASTLTVGGHVNLSSDSGFTAATTTDTSILGATSAASTLQSVSKLDVSTIDGANKALLTIDSALTSINANRAALGAIQNRFASTISNLQTTTENLSAARSRIQDTDFAMETANLTRGQILQQAGTAMLAQANSLPNGVLALLRG